MPSVLDINTINTHSKDTSRQRGKASDRFGRQYPCFSDPACINTGSSLELPAIVMYFPGNIRPSQDPGWVTLWPAYVLLIYYISISDFSCGRSRREDLNTIRFRCSWPFLSMDSWLLSRVLNYLAPTRLGQLINAKEQTVMSHCRYLSNMQCVHHFHLAGIGSRHHSCCHRFDLRFVFFIGWPN